MAGDRRRILIEFFARERVSPEAKRAGESIEDMGEDAKEAGKELDEFQRKIEATKKEVAELAREFIKTGDVDLKKRIGAQQRELGQMLKMQKLAESGKELGEDLGSGIFAGIKARMADGANLFAALPPQVQGPAIAAGAAIGVTMAGAIGGALTAGILLAVGGGVLFAGIKAAANDPRVTAAFGDLKKRASKSLEGFGEPFVEPLVRAADTFGDSLDRIAPKLKDMSKESAPLVDILAPALASMAERSMPGIQTALEKSRPLFEKLAEHAPKLGDAFSKFFDTISKGSPGAVEALDDILGTLEFLIVHIGNTIFMLSKMYEGAKAAWQKTAEVFVTGVQAVLSALSAIVTGASKAFSWIPGIGPKLKNAAKDFEEFKNRANNSLARIVDRNVNVNVTLRGIKNLEEQMAVRLGRRAAGGPVLAGQAYLVGEKGPEILAMGNSSGHVIPNHKAFGATTVDASPVVINLNFSGGAHWFDHLMIERIREAVRNGGGNVQVVFG